MDGPRHLFWNFVSSSRERIELAKADWKAERFGKVPGDEKEFIPLPEERVSVRAGTQRLSEGSRPVEPDFRPEASALGPYGNNRIASVGASVSPRHGGGGPHESQCGC